MNDAVEFLKSLRSDLTDRRLLPLIGAAVVALVGTLAYAALAGGGSSSPAPSSEAPTPVAHVPGVAVTPAQPGISAAIAETTNGTPLQRHGGTHNPFAPLVAVTASTLTARSASSSGAASGNGAATSKAGSGTTTKSTGSSPTHESTPTPPSKPKAPAKPKTVYEVTLATGPITAGSTQPSAALKDLSPLSKPTPLPSAAQKLVEFMGVTVTRKGTTATFAIVGEVIIRGAGVCSPSPEQCKLVNLKEGTSEQLEYIQPNGQPAALELKVQKIAKKQASAASFGVLVRAERAAGSSHEYGSFLAIAGLHYSQRFGVLAYSAPSTGWHKRR